MLIYTFIRIVIFFSGILVFRIKRKYFLLILLRLEFIILSLYFNMFIFLDLINNEYFFSIIFLRFRVCEGALGLSILVSLIRSHGNDYFQSFSILW